MGIATMIIGALMLSVLAYIDNEKNKRFDKKWIIPLSIGIFLFLFVIDYLRKLF
ncbi:hypothetical protein [Halalkalibacterium halodurans]|uniref:hypothetical protein n=1 Tax=Halalkalibacterium halodurans TaxID=86665 RepID=UPI001873D229|nr:hypothetical protein [Halalkalibacterium halodurans]